MTVIAWIGEGTWPACVDAARASAPEGEDIVLLHVSDRDIPASHTALTPGCWAAATVGATPAPRVEDLGAAGAEGLLDAAAGRLRPGLHPAGALRAHRAGGHRRGRRRRAARPGPRRRPARLDPGAWERPAGSSSLDHAPCPVLLAGLARTRAGHRDDPAPASPSAAPPVARGSAAALIASRAARPVTRGQLRDRHHSPDSAAGSGRHRHAGPPPRWDNEAFEVGFRVECM